jgi:predicted porin
MTTRASLFVLAASTFACAQAHAQSEVIVYGVAMPFLENVKTTGATGAPPSERPTMLASSAYTGVNDSSRWRMSSGTSNLGFRGYEQLGAGLRLVWQLESGFQIDQNTGPGLGARNSKAGLQGGWGEVFLGQWDTPYKFISLAINPFRAGYVFDYTPIMGNPGLGVPATTTQFTRVGAKPDAAFDKRVGNSVQYWSPRLGGFSARLGYSVDEGRTLDAPSSAGIKPVIWSAALMYDLGSLSLRYGFERHQDYFGLSALSSVPGSSIAATLTNRTSRDQAHKVVAIYRIGGTRIAGTIEELRYRNDDTIGGALSEYKRRAFYVLVEQQFGNNSIWGSYGKAQDGSCALVGGASCSTRAMGADYWTVGYIYRFSKRTEVFVTYYRLDNKESGTYSPQPIVGASIAPGADTVGAGVGILHYF